MKIKLILILLILTGCSSRYKMALYNKKEPRFSENFEVLVLNNASKINLESASLIAEVKGPFEPFYTSPKSVLKGCGYTEVINDMKAKSKELGANIIKVYDLQKPTSLNNCYKIKAKLYKSLDSNLIKEINEYNRFIRTSKLDDNANYALIHFYRPKAFNGTSVKYDILIENTLITSLKNGQKITYKVVDFGTHTFIGVNQKGKKKEFTIDIKKGQEYYVRCGVDVGRKFGVAQFSLLDNITGYSEYNEIKTINK